MKKFVSLLLVLILSLSLVIGMPLSVGAYSYIPLPYVDLDNFRFLRYYREFFEYEDYDDGRHTKEELSQHYEETEYGGYNKDTWRSGDVCLSELFTQIEDFNDCPMLYVDPESGYSLRCAYCKCDKQTHLDYYYDSADGRFSIVVKLYILQGEERNPDALDFVWENDYAIKKQNRPLPIRDKEITIGGQTVPLYLYRLGAAYYTYLEADAWEDMFFTLTFLDGEAAKNGTDPVFDSTVLEHLKVASLAQFESEEFTEFYSLPDLLEPRTETFIAQESARRVAARQQKMIKDALWICIPLIPIFVGIVNFCVRRFKKKKSTPTK